MASAQDITNYETRLLPHIIDERAKTKNERPYALYPVSPDLSEGFHSVSFAKLSNAINRACWWLNSNISEKEAVFAYMGPNDLRYVIFLLAAWKTGRKILICSLRNTIDAQKTLFERVNCKILVSAHSLDHSLQSLFAVLVDVRMASAPELDDLLNEDTVPHYEYNETYETAVNEHVLHIHTSGSSGNPKPISWTKMYFCAWKTGNELPVEQGAPLVKTLVDKQTFLPLLPCFHGGGLAFNLFPALYDGTLVLGHPDVPMSTHYVSELLNIGIITSIISPPSIIEDLSKEANSIQHLVKLSHIAYGGGPLNPDVGNMLAPVVPHLCSVIGATEVGWFHTVSGQNSTWDCIRYFDGIGYRFDEVAEGIFELVVVNNPLTNRYHGVFEVFPDLKEYRVRDLYTKNPNAPGWMRYRGRADDLIVLSNGEKINPIPMENIIGAHQDVRAALVVGEYQFSPSLLVELKDDKIPKTDEERQKALDTLWPSIQKANEIAPAFAKVSRSLVLFATAEKPFSRAGKGTVQRQLTVKAYTNELERLFSSQEPNLLTEGLSLRNPASPTDIRLLVREIFTQAMEQNGLMDYDDVFQLGVDSLKVAIIVSRLRAALQHCAVPVDMMRVNARLVYSAPSVNDMVEIILTLSGKRNTGSSNDGVEIHSRKGKMQTLLETYSKNMLSGPLTSANDTRKLSKGWTIILTGTTGSLGSYLLDKLYKMPSSEVNKVICLHRSSEGIARQRISSSLRGLNSSWDDHRVQFLQADFARGDLGLSSETYAELLSDVTVILHSAWQVNFNLSLDTFQPQIRGVRNLLDFSAKSAHQAPLIFISSISTVFGFMDKHPGSVVPEAIIDDFDAPEPIGYGESKFVSELLIEKFAKSTGINAAIFRTGQIAGPLSEKGFWNKQEWFPSLMASSKHLGALPKSLGGLGTVDWIPVDLLASIMIDLTAQLVRQDNIVSTTVYNLINPKSTEWSRIARPLQQLTEIPRMVELQQWVELLDESSKERNGAIVETNPAVKLLDFFRSLARQPTKDKETPYEVKALVRDSETAANMEAIRPEWIELWMSKWM